MSICGSQREKPKSLRTWYGGMYIKKKPNRGTCPVKERNMEVFGNDFATVYFREDYATIAAPKRQNFGEKGTFDVFRLKRQNCGDI